MDTTLQFQLNLIDFYCPFSYLLEYRKSDYAHLHPSSYIPNSSVYCPFHENTDSKAAKLYPKDNEKPYERIYCFAENRLFQPHALLSPPKDIIDKKDIYRFHSIVPYTPQWVFNAIWNNLPQKDREYWEGQPEYTPPEQKHIAIYDLYRKGSVDLFSVLKSFL